MRGTGHFRPHWRSRQSPKRATGPFGLGCATISSGPSIVLSPHYDDAVLNCWSVLAAPESDVTVVNVFGGVPRSREPGDWDRVCEVADARELVVTRMKEDRGALARTGSRAINLPFAERQYRRVSIRPTFSRTDAELCSGCPAVGRVLARSGWGTPTTRPFSDMPSTCSSAGYR